MNAVVYSLWGNDPRYCLNASRCARRIRELLPEWTPVFFLGSDVNVKTRDALLAENCLLLKPPKESPNPLFWRFFFRDTSFDRFIIRDADSIPIPREIESINRWIASEQPFHVIRDHPHHTNPMMAGLWGAITSQMPDIKAWLKSFQVPSGNDVSLIYDSDQRFLAARLWPLIRDTTFQHDLCTRHLFPEATPFTAPFPDSQEGWRFCGEVYMEDGSPRDHDWEMRINWMTCEQ